MYLPSAWQREQVSATFSGYTFERVSFTARMPCTPWQSMQTATLVSPPASRLPCTLVLYCANWSVRSEGLYCRM